MSDDKSVDEIVGEFQKFKKSGGKPFKERAKKFEEFFDPEKFYSALIAQHAEYIARGKPSDLTNFPGAYNVAYRKLEEKVSGNYDKVEDDELLKEIIESYVDTFLEGAATEKLEKAMRIAEEKGLSKEDIQKMKGNLFAQYHMTERGALNPLSDDFIKRLKGKTKIEIIAELSGLANTSINLYSQFLTNKATYDIFDSDDQIDLAEHYAPRFEKEGWKHDDHILTHTYDKLISSIQHLLTGNGKELEKAGYKKHVPDEDKEEE